MRKEVARLVHHLDAALAIGDPDVDVQTEDEQLADHVLELLLDADREPRHIGDPHAVPSTTYVGTTLPAPAVTLRSSLDETRACVPETLPQNRYGSWSIERSRKCMRSSSTGNGYRGTAT